MFYSSFGMLALVLNVIINFEVLVNRGDPERAKIRRVYRRFILASLLYFCSDICWGILYDARTGIFAYADTVLYFASMVLTVLMWTRYIVMFLGKNNELEAFLTLSGWIIFGFEFIVLIVNFFNPIVFEFTKEGEYIPLHARYVTLFLQILLFLITSLYAFAVSYKSSGKEKLHYLTVGSSGLVMTIFIILQAIDPFVPYYAIGLLIGQCMIHTFVIADARADYNQKLGSVQDIAYKDSLTGVRSSHAYKEAKDFLNKRIEEGTLDEFGVVVFDVNGLKTINDTYGHDAGDKCIRNASRLICDEFKHSPVFRIGGDEFVAFLEGEDYRNRDALLDDFDTKIEDNLRSGQVVISSGLKEYSKGEDLSYEAIFEKADRMMYDRKNDLKSRGMGAGKP